MSELMLDVGQANELKLAFRRANYTNDDIKRLCEGTILSDVRNVLVGRAEITLASHVIDCDAYPFVPDGWRVEEHQKAGKLKWDPTKVELYRSSSQKKGKYIEGNLLRKELSGKSVLNANVLDYLRANPELIPESWKEKSNGNTTYIFFWGTIYRSSGDYFYVRCLYWFGGQWRWHYRWLGLDFYDYSPAALRAS